VTAFVVQDLLGGDLLLGEVFERGERRGRHYWNRLPDGADVDLTGDQFHPSETVTEGALVVRPSGPPGRCRGQYELLRHRVLASLAEPVDARSAAPASPPVRIALALLIDSDGAVLLQLRDRDARAEPGQWSLPGGHVEDDEDYEQAARRELAEETGLALETEFELFWQDLRADLAGCAPAVDVRVYSARCGRVSPDAIIIAEGQAAEFVSLADVTNRDLSPTAAAVLSHLLTGSRGGVQ
jgi:8-oxo-dGTP pyrophosphatase MutT (NUDIX family)